MPKRDPVRAAGLKERRLVRRVLGEIVEANKQKARECADHDAAQDYWAEAAAVRFALEVLDEEWTMADRKKRGKA